MKIIIIKNYLVSENSTHVQNFKHSMTDIIPTGILPIKAAIKNSPKTKKKKQLRLLKNKKAWRGTFKIPTKSICWIPSSVRGEEREKDGTYARNIRFKAKNARNLHITPSNLRNRMIIEYNIQQLIFNWLIQEVISFEIFSSRHHPLIEFVHDWILTQAYWSK